MKLIPIIICEDGVSAKAKNPFEKYFYLGGTKIISQDWIDFTKANASYPLIGNKQVPGSEMMGKVVWQSKEWHSDRWLDGKVIHTGFETRQAYALTIPKTIDGFAPNSEIGCPFDEAGTVGDSKAITNYMKKVIDKQDNILALEGSFNVIISKEGKIISFEEYGEHLLHLSFGDFNTISKFFNMIAGYNAGEGKWIGVEDALPEIGIDVLCTDNFECYAIGWYANDNFFNDKVMNVTHWQPLPTPPTTLK
jgi:hypothetical protein